MAPILALAQTHSTVVMTTVAATATKVNTTSSITNSTSTANNATVIISSNTIGAIYTSPTCDADLIVDHCLALTTINQEDCDTNDFACQCIRYQAIDTCFDNCPDDPRQRTYAGQIAQYCALAGLPTTNTALAPSTSATATSTRLKPGSTGTPTSDQADSSQTANRGAKLAKGAATAMAAVAGIVVAVL